MRVLPLTFSRAPRVVVLSVGAMLFGAARTAGAQDQPKPAATQDNRKPAPTFTNATPLAADEVEHVVKKGDTLWDIAKEFLKDPFKWPEVFSRNSDIVENPHWIYPGENIRIPRGEVKPEVLAKIDTKAVPATPRTVFSVTPGMYSDRLQSDGSVIGRNGSNAVPQGEIEAAPFGDRKGGPAGSGSLAAAYDRPGIEAPDGERRFQLHDRVFVKMPKGVVAFSGQLLLTYRLGEDISDDAQLVIPTGIVRVESQQLGQPALASVVRQFEEIRLGQSLMLLQESGSNSGTLVPVSAGQSEKVIYIGGNNVLPSLQSYVVLTSRPATSVHVGDRFTLMDDSVDPRYPAPPVPAAVAEVVKVTPFAVTAILIDQDQPRIRTGMTARLTARLP